MCGFGRMNNSKEKFMTFDQFKEIYDSVKDQTQSIRINGRGESTIHPEFKEIVEYIGKEKEIILFSNGNYSNPIVTELFNNYNFQLYFSMDSTMKSKLESIRKGIKAERLIQNIKSVQEMKKRPFIIFTVQEENIDEIVNIAEFALSMNCNIIYNVVRRDVGIEPFVELVKQKKDEILSSFLVVKEMYSMSLLNSYIPDQMAGVVLFENETATCGTTEECPNIKTELCILYNGDVTPCNMFNPYIYGNINDSELDEILKGDKFNWFLQNHKSYYYCNNCACLKR
jgi:MoaA/NifB/PqqE/SkfB family radical SAM enzyme